MASVLLVLAVLIGQEAVAQRYPWTRSRSTARRLHSAAETEGAGDRLRV